MTHIQSIDDIQELANVVHKAVAEMKDAPSVALEEKDGKYCITGAGIMISAELAPGHVEFVRHGVRSEDVRFFSEKLPIDYKEGKVHTMSLNNIHHTYRAITALLEAETALQNSRFPKNKPAQFTKGYDKLDEMFS